MKFIELLQEFERWSDGENVVLEADIFCEERGLHPAYADAIVEVLMDRAALAAGIPASVVFGYSKLSDHFTQDYINYKKGEKI